MTDPMELPAGRELDALVAEKVMGWHAKDGRWHNAEGKDLGSDHADNDDQRGDYYYPDERWCPSTSIAAAWEAGEKAGVFSRYLLSAKGDGTGCGIYELDDGGDFYIVAEADTAPLAICRAALKAVGTDAP